VFAPSFSPVRVLCESRCYHLEPTACVGYSSFELVHFGPAAFTSWSRADDSRGAEVPATLQPEPMRERGFRFTSNRPNGRRKADGVHERSGPCHAPKGAAAGVRSFMALGRARGERCRSAAPSFRVRPMNRSESLWPLCSLAVPSVRRLRALLAAVASVGLVTLACSTVVADEVPRTVQSPPKKSPTRTPKTKDTWRSDARKEYLEALEAKEARMSANSERLGSLNPSEYEGAKQALRSVRDNGLDNSSSNTVALASKIAPDYIAALKREKQMADPNYATQAKAGKVPLRYPTEKRKQFHAELVRVTGMKQDWSLVVPFDNLTAAEMDDLKATLGVIEKSGFPKLTSDQRKLLLKAGALDYFADQIGDGK
jgi:hypothetical protein